MNPTHKERASSSTVAQPQTDHDGVELFVSFQSEDGILSDSPPADLWCHPGSLWTSVAGMMKMRLLWSKVTPCPGPGPAFTPSQLTSHGSLPHMFPHSDVPDWCLMTGSGMMSGSRGIQEYSVPHLEIKAARGEEDRGTPGTVAP